jgi:microcystin-dependent protein
MTDPRQIKVTFAFAGDVSTTLDDAQLDGTVSFTEGYTFDYQRPKASSPLAKDISRTQQNGLFKDAFDNIQQYQQYGTPPWYTGTAYAQFSRVRYSGAHFYSKVANNTSTPGSDDTWALFNRPIAPDFSNNIAGNVSAATLSGSNNVVLGGLAATISGGNNIVMGANGSTVSGNSNIVLDVPSQTIPGDHNLVINSSSLSLDSSSSNNTILSSPGTHLTTSGRNVVLASQSASATTANSSAIFATVADCTLSSAFACVIHSAVESDINDVNRASIQCAETCVISDGGDSSMILASSFVEVDQDHVVALGYAATGPASPSNVKILLDAKTGNATFSGTVDASNVTIGGSPIVGRVDNLTATTDPGVNDDSTDGYTPLSRWVNTTTTEIWTCITNTVGAAHWELDTLDVSDLGNLALVNGTTIGLSLVQLTNPSAVTFPRYNADNTVSTRSAAQIKTDLALNNVDNTSNATERAATATLTNKTMSGANNSFSNIPATAVLPLLGEIRMWAGATAPTNWSFCNGALLNIASFPALYAILGTAYGGNGVTTFGLPDLRGRNPCGVDGSNARGSTGGADTHALVVDNLPNHSHGIVVGDQMLGNTAMPDSSNKFLGMALDANIWAPSRTNEFTTDNGNTETVGFGTAFDTRDKYQAVNFIIATVGV